jgi:GNAT superfamily N-acetyltransferase
MKILTYRDLKSNDTLLPLMDQAFRWPFNPKRFEDLVKIDPRLKDGPVGFCAVENERIVGFVGVLDLVTRTVSKTVEHVGGLYGVATLPGYTRKGISTALMNSAHEYFREKGYRFSFLDTSPTLIAYAFYKKLGYVDATEYRGAYKVVEAKKTKPLRIEKTSRLDFDGMLRIYNEFSKDKTGFVIRDKAYLRMLKKSEGLTSKQCIITDDGYALFRGDKEGVWIRELVALNVKEMERLISRIEEKVKALVIYDRAVLDNALLRVYESRGYIIQEKSHGVMMAKSLTADASFVETYGAKFYIDDLDHF